MKYPSQIRHIDSDSYYIQEDYSLGTKNKREIAYKLSLLEELRGVEMNQHTRGRLESKVESFIQELSESSLDSVISYHIENIIDNSIVIRFSQRRDIRLNLYYDDTDDMGYDNHEEAYLSYIQDSRRIILIGSIAQITPTLSSLLS